MCRKAPIKIMVPMSAVAIASDFSFSFSFSSSERLWIHEKPWKRLFKKLSIYDKLFDKVRVNVF
jgi:hypothetical protein